MYELIVASTQADVHIKFNQNSSLLIELQGDKCYLHMFVLCVSHRKLTITKHMEYPHMYTRMWKLIILKVLNLT
jgi:hypothetical protein